MLLSQRRPLTPSAATAAAVAAAAVATAASGGGGLDRTSKLARFLFVTSVTRGERASTTTTATGFAEAAGRAGVGRRRHGRLAPSAATPPPPGYPRTTSRVRPAFSALPPHPRAVDASARFLSAYAAASSSSEAIPPPSAPPPPVATSLRNFSKPFLLKCHPDTQISPLARTVNLAAVQTLNGMIDAVEALASGRATGANKNVELKSRYEIEFMVAASDPASGIDGTIRKNKIHKKLKETGAVGTRRSVVLSFPASMREDLDDAAFRSAAAGNVAAGRRLRSHARREIAKLLRVAGLPVPHSDGFDDFDNPIGRDDGLEGALLSELEFDYGDSSRPPVAGTRFVRRPSQQQRRTKTRYEASRDKFMDSIDWEAHRKLYDDAYEDMKADLMTAGQIRWNRRRKDEFVSGIVSRIRVAPPSSSSPSSSPSGEVEEEGEVGAEAAGHVRVIDFDRDDGLDVVHQLIAIRRLSLLLADNFDELEMEQFGSLWENSTIVLTPARDDSINPGIDATPSARRRARKRGGTESGFKFTYDADGSVTIGVPVDFRDDELLAELDKNVWDFFNMCGDGLEEFWPSHWRALEDDDSPVME